MKHKQAVWLTDEEILTIIQRKYEQDGYVVIQDTAVECYCSTYRVGRIMDEANIPRLWKHRPNGKRRSLQERDNMFIRECRKAIKEEGLDTPLGNLLSLLTGVSQVSLQRLVNGTSFNFQRVKRTGVTYQSGLTIIPE